MIKMKRFITLLVLMISAFSVTAQIPDPVQWSYSSKKISDKTYELHLTANIQNNWHLYSQTQPADAINEPTSICFLKNPLVTLTGKTKEVGKMEFFNDSKLKISANQYSGKVDFVQIVKLRANIKTNIVGTVEYQTCDDKKCLPPKKINFSIAVN